MSRLFATDEHHPIDLVRSTYTAHGPTWDTFVPGPITRVQCSCGWSAHADDVNVYEAAKEHAGWVLP